MTAALVKGLIERHGVFADYNGYRLVPIYRKPDAEAREAVIKLWHANKILPDRKAAEERSKQVVFLIIDPQDNVVGVNTVYVSDFSKAKQKPAPAGNFYFYRMFIQPQNRVPNLSFRTLGFTYDFLNALPVAPRPEGLVLVTENPKLKKPGSQRLLKRMGWDTLAQNEMGQFVMKRDFIKPC
ncbi:MAG: hypothetical protein ACAH80_13505 [Alphaproteobacteria bacterium]